ncbi:hypothetical protein ACH5RR_012879 [Cinchona calisaya]|uniref:Uncharacterized protein n=1 Tax=Cinchona calisaya TaxID=153742 RepID=A0ABD3A9J5_9GENT
MIPIPILISECEPITSLIVVEVVPISLNHSSKSCLPRRHTQQFFLDFCTKFHDQKVFDIFWYQSFHLLRHNSPTKSMNLYTKVNTYIVTVLKFIKQLLSPSYGPS